MSDFPEQMVNLAHYNAEMRKPLIDKAFFLDKIESQIFVDFGCADGMLINFMEMLFPENTYIGFDISETELAVARKHTKSALFSDWDKLIEHLNKIKGDRKVTVICNSLIHEVYAYCSKREIKEFWERIYSGFDYVVIRDMSVSRTTSRQSDSISVAKVRQLANLKHLAQFEEEWGSINENWALVHFLLKYRYVDNWEREVKENYLPLKFEDLLALAPREYEPIYLEHFTVPWIRNRVLEDFGVDLQDRTHVKIILKKKI